MAFLWEVWMGLEKHMVPTWHVPPCTDIKQDLVLPNFSLGPPPNLEDPSLMVAYVCLLGLALPEDSEKPPSFSYTAPAFLFLSKYFHNLYHPEFLSLL